MRRLTLAALMVAMFTWAVPAMIPAHAADADPTMHQIYQTAESGNLDRAQEMITQVLRDHPNSAKAHYVQAELFAREGKIASARAELAHAEELAPGLPFARSGAVQALRSELAVGTGLAHRGSDSDGVQPTSPGARIPWGGFLLVLLIAGAAWMFMRRRQTPAVDASPLPPAAPSGAYPGAPSPGGGYASTMGGGLGSNIAGGLATGLAVGAGVVAGEELAHHLLDRDRRESMVVPPSDEGVDRRDVNADLGGNDFGVNDASSWDDGGSSDGGGDWS